MRVLGDEIDLADALGVHLEGDLLRRQFAVDVLAAGHRGRVVIEQLVGDVGAGGDRLADRQRAGMEIGAVAEIGEDMLFLGEGRHAHPRHALAAHMREGLGVAVHPQRHEVAADAGEGAAAFRHLGRGVVRTARAEIRRAGNGRDRLHLSCLPAIEPVGLGAQHLGDLRIEIKPKQAFAQRACQRSDGKLGGEGQEALVVIVHLADDARADVVAPVEQLLLDLVLDDLAPFLDDEDLFEPDRKLTHTFRLQRPGHADLVETNADLGRNLLGNPEFAQRLADILVALAGCHDAVAGIRRIQGNAVDLVGAGERNRRIALVVLQAQVLLIAIVGPADVEATRRHLEVGGDDEGLHLVGEVDLGRGLHGLGDHLHADPATGVARHRDTQQAHLDHFMDAGGIEIGHQRGNKGVVGLMRDGRGLCAVVVAGKHQHAAILGRTCRVGVAEDVAAAVDAGPLAVPDADHAIILRAGGQAELLRTPDRGRRQVLVHAGLELDVVLLEVFSRCEELLVITAERRAAVARNEACRIQPHRAVAPDLGHGQAHQRLDTRQEDVACPLGVFLVETDRTLVDSHLSPRKPWSFRPILVSGSSCLEPVYVGFFIRRDTNLAPKAPSPKIATSCPGDRQPISIYVAQRAWRETA
ncbi:hypothetical protein ES707_01247 [subsurface metagenome]